MNELTSKDPRGVAFQRNIAIYFCSALENVRATTICRPSAESVKLAVLTYLIASNVGITHRTKLDHTERHDKFGPGL